MTEARKGREGSRWINVRPTGEEFADWFKTVPIHEGLDHEDFISGITLIQQTEKVNEVVGFDQSGQPEIIEMRHLVYVPYAKVDTRVAYFWKFMELHPDWLGVIEPVAYPGSLAKNAGLPPGFFPHVQTFGTDRRTVYVGCSMQVRILERESVQWRDVVETGPDGQTWRRRVAEGKPIQSPPPGTKIAATTGKYEADHFSLMKAETGAVGRALGMAGMLVIPGSGVATAEDMQEAQAPQAVSTAGGPTAELPSEVADQATDPDALRGRIASILTELGNDYPDALAEFQAWARERKFSTLEELTGPQMKGVLGRLEKLHDAAKRTKVADAPALVAAD